jgi:hypothetical protein
VSIFVPKMTSQFPLRKVTTPQLQQLAHLLWGWSICSECLACKPCKTEDCPWPRSTVLGKYFEFYKDLTGAYESDIKYGEKPGLNSHEELFEIINELKLNPDLTRGELLDNLFPERPARSDQERALNLAVRVMLMVNVSASRRSSDLLEHGSHQSPWRNDVGFSQFLTDAFPKTDHPSIAQIKENLRAKKLKKTAGLRFQPTDDLRNHLRLDRKGAIVEIFHHTAFLKEHLRRTKDECLSVSASDSIKK